MSILDYFRGTVLCTVAVVAPVAAQDPVLQWNDSALNAIRATNTPPPAAARSLAIVHAAIHDAMNGIRPRYEQYLVPPNVDRRASAKAAASTAARDALVALFPTQAATFDALLSTILATIETGEPKLRGITWGQQVAAQILAARANDGSTATGSYPGSLIPGMWRPTLSFGNIVRPALLPLWGNVTPFVIASTAQYRPPAPPDLTSALYAYEVIQAQLFGDQLSTLRTADQTQFALFWGYGPSTATPPGHWNQIAQVVVRKHRLSEAKQARLLALMNLALADAAIVSWDCKYLYGLWRPITAIQLADQDGNALTVADPNWMPLLPTPPFPEYTSGHSTFSGAAAAVLGAILGDDTAFSVGSDDLPGVMRSYSSFSEAAQESGLSRIYGGIHFMSANTFGLSIGNQLGTYAVQNWLRPAQS